VQNLFRYALALNSTANTTELYSLGLLIDSEEHFELNDPIVHSLMGPQAQGSSGEIYMSPAFRLALEEDRVYFRVLASGLPVNGVTHALR
jgi:pantothenate kinase-related protein Tda10